MEEMKRARYGKWAYSFHAFRASHSPAPLCVLSSEALQTSPFEYLWTLHYRVVIN